MKDLPNIDPSLLKPGGVNIGNGNKAPISLGEIRWQEPHAHKGIMTMDEIAMAERALGDFQPRRRAVAHAEFARAEREQRAQFDKLIAEKAAPTRAHGHYFKDVGHLSHVDVYRTLALFNVTDPCLQHAVKKLLVAGGRGGGKDISRDIQEAIDTLVRWQEMRAEEAAP